MENAKYWITDTGFIIGPFTTNHSEKVSSEIREKVLFKYEFENFDIAEEEIKENVLLSGWIRVIVLESENKREIIFEGIEEKVKDKIIVEKMNLLKADNNCDKMNIVLR